MGSKAKIIIAYNLFIIIEGFVEAVYFNSELESRAKSKTVLKIHGSNKTLKIQQLNAKEPHVQQSARKRPKSIIAS